MSLLGFSQNFVDVIVKFPDLLVRRMIGFYGCLERYRRIESWDILINLSTDELKSHQFSIHFSD